MIFFQNCSGIRVFWETDGQIGVVSPKIVFYCFLGCCAGSEFKLGSVRVILPLVSKFLDQYLGSYEFPPITASFGFLRKKKKIEFCEMRFGNSNLIWKSCFELLNDKMVYIIEKGLFRTFRLL